MMSSFGATWVLTLAAALGAGPADEAAAPRVGNTIADFALDDHLGARHALGDWQEKKAVVVVFFGVECPLAKLYGPRLTELANEYAAKGVQFVGIDSNLQDSLAEITHYARTHGIDFPLLKDPGNRVADQFGAVRTPEVFLLDEGRVVRYWGRIDDQFGVGYARDEVTRRDLALAIDELLAGKAISTPATEAVGCYIGRVRRTEPTGEITYTKHIAPILNRRCVTCHREGQIAPFALTDYEEIVGWAPTLAEVINDERMPPWHAHPAHGEFSNDARMPDEEKLLVDRWVKNGAPQGDPADLPPAPEFAEGWQIPKPDAVYKMPRPFTAPAKGVVEYKYFMVDPGFTEDKWVKYAEARPGNRSVVHHLILFYHPPGKERIDPAEPLFNVVAAFAPGMPAAFYPAATARRIPAGSKLVFQVHYTPTGSEQTDVSDAGLVFADPDEVKKEVQVGAALNFLFQIPAGESNYKVEAKHKFEEPQILYSLTPHMHLRGKSFRFDAIYPDGKREILLDVPRYDFNWQNIYELAEPKLMPVGAELHCTAHFDNSAGNLVNPDPTKAVRWGDQTWEEMMVGTFGFAPAEQDLQLGGPKITKLENGRFEVTFKYRPPALPTLVGKSPAPSAVYLAGSFNEWQPTSHKMDGPDSDGVYTTNLSLDEGQYEYKFVINGDTWRADPGNRDQVGFYRNSLLRVGND